MNSSNLIKRMRAFASELSDASNIKVTLDVNEKMIETSINMVQRRNVYLIYKEALNNAFKYSNASNINVVLDQVGKKIQLKIVDNGIEFEKDELKLNDSLGGNGLKNMAIRATALDGTLTIISEPNKGTEIRFTWNPNFEQSTSPNK